MVCEFPNRVFPKHKYKLTGEGPVSVVFLKSLSSSVDARKISDTFQYRVKPPFSNPSGLVWTRTKTHC